MNPIELMFLRRTWRKADRKRDRGLVTPDDVKRYDNIPYGNDHVWNLLDVYRPAGENGPLPVILSIHGGGWFYGTKEVYQYYLMSLAERGFAVINFNYHLAPEMHFPGQFREIGMVVDWMYQKADEYKMDLDRVFLIGDSAGGHYAGMYTNICVNRAYEDELKAAYPDVFDRGTVPHSFVPRAVGLHCGAYSMQRSYEEKKSLNWKCLNNYFGAMPDQKILALTDVPQHVTADFPPTFIFTAENDFLKEQMPLLTARFDEAGVKYVSHVFGSGNPEIGHVFHCNIRLPEAGICNDEECEFFRKC